MESWNSMYENIVLSTKKCTGRPAGIGCTKFLEPKKVFSFFYQLLNCSHGHQHQTMVPSRVPWVFSNFPTSPTELFIAQRERLEWEGTFN